MPRRGASLRTWQLLVVAGLAVLGWWFAQHSTRAVLHPEHATMLRAARTMTRGMDAIQAEKQERGLLVDRRHDPNRTGLIGPQWSPIVTTYGELSAKRTAGNPDLAAAMVAELGRVPEARGDVIVTVVSGSLVGANLAVLAALEAMDLHVVLVSSLGASMWGATDPEFTWLEIEAALREARVIDVRSTISVLGGDMALGGGIEEEGRAALRESARRHDVPVWERQDLVTLTREVFDRAVSDAGGLDNVRAFVNVGGSMLSLGLCRAAASYPVGLSHRRLPCVDGVPGLMSMMSNREVPIMHVLNIEEMALRYGLPLDPRPLPRIGENPRVYGNR